MFDRAKYKDDNQDWEKIPDPAASLKHDGANFFMVVGKDGSIRYFSRRKGVKGNFPERTAQLPQLTSKKLPQFAGNVYNIELVHTGHSSLGKEDHPKLSGILNSLPAKSLQDQQNEGPVRAILLNVIHPKINTYGEKLDHLDTVAKAYGEPTILKPISVKIGKDNIHSLIDSTKGMCQEGVIVTSLTKPEQDNARIKVKHFNTWNLKVTKINQEYDKSGNPKQSAGSLTVADSTGREVANVGTGLSRELRADIWNNPKNWLSREIQVKARNPSRRRLIAPVYNGEPDGSMDKVATLEDQLLNNLMAKYKEKGANPQKVMDHPLFQQLPLAKKVELLDRIKPAITQAPKLNLSAVGSSAVGGGISGAIAGMLFSTMKGSASPVYRNYGLVVGGIAGGLGGALRAHMDKKRDAATQQAATNSSLDALIARSGSSPIGGSPFGPNKYLETLESLSERHLPQIVHSQYGN